MAIDRNILDESNLKKLKALQNEHVTNIVDEYIALLKPAKVTVITDSKEDIAYVRDLALANGEESKMAIEGHTVHFDGYFDQARDKGNTRVLINEDMKLCKGINTCEREAGLKEVRGIMDGMMEGKEALVRFFCLGPRDSRFSLCALQITDSSYVGHSEDILYRTGYEQFKKLNGSDNFFSLIHSAGELDERGNTKNIDQRRIYIDLLGNKVLTANNQYAGNSLGLKKLALRLAIFKANNEDWLTEHMFIMGIKPEGKDRTTYFTGAYPSACGKTSTAMVSGQSIVGDDIAYLREGKDGYAYAVNIEQGIFGIITDVNPDDDPVIHRTLSTPRELIFSNILVKDGVPYWNGMGQELPAEGRNFTGDWKLGNKHPEDGKEIPHAHKNARYTVRIEELENADSNLENPDGVPVQGVIYGGRDSDTSVPVYQSLSWAHGVFIGAAIESETTAATLGQEGVRNFSPMANLDFLVVPLGKYIQNHLNFGDKLEKTPTVFATNYFLKEDGQFLNGKLDKKVWLIWMEGRVHGEYDAIESPIGFIPEYKDLKELFKSVLGKDYPMTEYEQQFSVRIEKWLAKLDRIEAIYAEECAIPEEFSDCLNNLRARLKAAQAKAGSSIIKPSSL